MTRRTSVNFERIKKLLFSAQSDENASYKGRVCKKQPC